MHPCRCLVLCSTPPPPPLNPTCHNGAQRVSTVRQGQRYGWRWYAADGGIHPIELLMVTFIRLLLKMVEFIRLNCRGHQYSSPSHCPTKDSDLNPLMCLYPKNVRVFEAMKPILTNIEYMINIRAYFVDISKACLTSDKLRKS